MTERSDFFLILMLDTHSNSNVLDRLMLELAPYPNSMPELFDARPPLQYLSQFLTFKSMTNRSFVKVQTLYTSILYLNIRKANNKFNFTSRRQILHFIFFSYGPQNPCTVSYRYRWMDCVNN